VRNFGLIGNLWELCIFSDFDLRCK
jgi:hypothetical protein